MDICLCMCMWMILPEWSCCLWRLFELLLLSALSAESLVAAVASLASRGSNFWMPLGVELLAIDLFLGSIGCGPTAEETTSVVKAPWICGSVGLNGDLMSMRLRTKVSTASWLVPTDVRISDSIFALPYAVVDQCGLLRRRVMACDKKKNTTKQTNRIQHVTNYNICIQYACLILDSTDRQ